MVPSVYFIAVALHAADDLQSQPGLAAAVVLALVADDVGVFARLEKHLHDRAVVDAADDRG